MTVDIGCVTESDPRDPERAFHRPSQAKVERYTGHECPVPPCVVGLDVSVTPVCWFWPFEKSEGCWDGERGKRKIKRMESSGTDFPGAIAATAYYSAGRIFVAPPLKGARKRREQTLPKKMDDFATNRVCLKFLGRMHSRTP